LTLLTNARRLRVSRLDVDEYSTSRIGRTLATGFSKVGNFSTGAGATILSSLRVHFLNAGRETHFVAQARATQFVTLMGVADRNARAVQKVHVGGWQNQRSGALRIVTGGDGLEKR